MHWNTKGLYTKSTSSLNNGLLSILYWLLTNNLHLLLWKELLVLLNSEGFLTIIWPDLIWDLISCSSTAPVAVCTYSWGKTEAPQSILRQKYIIDNNKYIIITSIRVIDLNKSCWGNQRLCPLPLGSFCVLPISIYKDCLMKFRSFKRCAHCHWIFPLLRGTEYLPVKLSGVSSFIRATSLSLESVS